MSGVFGALKNLTDEVQAQGEVQRLTRRDIAKLARCLDETLEILREIRNRNSGGSVTPARRSKRSPRKP